MGSSPIPGTGKAALSAAFFYTISKFSNFPVLFGLFVLVNLSCTKLPAYRPGTLIVTGISEALGKEIICVDIDSGKLIRSIRLPGVVSQTLIDTKEIN